LGRRIRVPMKSRTTSHKIVSIHTGILLRTVTRNVERGETIFETRSGIIDNFPVRRYHTRWWY